MKIICRMLFLLAVMLLVVSPVFSADNRNDGNSHDTREGAEEDEGGPGGPDEDDECSTSSPVLIENGEFIWSDTDVVLKGRPLIALSRHYRSYDSREGIFGKGWTTDCEKALIRVLDFIPSDPENPDSPVVSVVKYIYRLANGRRYEFVETSPNTFSSPEGLPNKSLTVDANGKALLSDIDASEERYDQFGKLEAEIDRNGNVVSYAYENGALTSISDGNGRFLQLAYDTTGHVSRVTDQNSRVWQYSYAEDGTLISVTNPLGAVHTYEYQNMLRTASNQQYQFINRIVDAGGVDVVSVAYTEEGKAESYTVGTNTYTYSERRGFIYKTDSLNSQWSFATDENGMKTEVFPPINRGEPELYEYDADGNLIIFTDLDGTEFLRSYDDLGRVQTVTTPDGVSSFDYQDGKLWPSELISASGRVTRVEYDSAGNPTQIIDPGGNATKLTWSAEGDLLNTVDALGNESSSTYNQLGLKTSVTDALGSTTTFEYDGRGNLSVLTDASGNVTRYTYDALDRAVSVVAALGQTTTTSYDGAGRVTAMTDAAGGTTALGYDIYGRRISETRPDGSTVTYTFREDNLVDTMTDARGVVTQYSYDRGQRLTGVTAAGSRNNYTYDTLGRVTQARSSGSSISFEYDSMHRPVLETEGQTSISYTYNVDGELASMGLLGEERLYEYNARGLISAMTTPTGIHTYRYDALGRETEHTYPNGASAIMTYDAVGQLTQQDYSAFGGDVLSYSWDELGRVEQISGGIYDRLYQYDAIGQLTGASHEQNYSYQYDALGNRLENGGVYDAFNKLLENSEFDFSYDESGSMLSRVNKLSGQETRYEWDGMKRLASVATAPAVEARADSTVTFRYDAYDRRISKSVGSDTTNYRWSGDNLVAEFTSSRTTPTAIYRYKDGYTATEYTDEQSTYQVQTDHLDSATSLLSDVGTIHSADKTDPYGALESSDALESSTSGAPVFNQRFPGQYADRETGLSYNRHRYYDPSIGRYISSDPIGIQGGMNTYAYASASPTMMMDVFGLSTTTGSWVQRPTLSSASARPTGLDFIRPSWNWWGYLNLIRVHGSITGTISAAVQCMGTDDCGKPREWTVSTNVQISHSGSVDLGPNIYALVLGLRFGPLVSIGANLAIITARASIALAGLYQEYGEKARIANQQIMQRGPDAICRGGF